MYAMSAHGYELKSASYNVCAPPLTLLKLIEWSVIEESVEFVLEESQRAKC